MYLVNEKLRGTIQVQFPQYLKCTSGSLSIALILHACMDAYVRKLSGYIYKLVLFLLTNPKSFLYYSHNYTCKICLMYSICMQSEIPRKPGVKKDFGTINFSQTNQELSSFLVHFYSACNCVVSTY